MIPKKYRVVLVGCGSIADAWLDIRRDYLSHCAEMVGFTKSLAMVEGAVQGAEKNQQVSLREII